MCESLEIRCRAFAVVRGPAAGSNLAGPSTCMYLRVSVSGKRNVLLHETAVRQQRARPSFGQSRAGSVHVERARMDRSGPSIFRYSKYQSRDKEHIRIGASLVSRSQYIS